MPVFDPTQPHGQVCGPAVRLWEQNGVLFDATHRPVEFTEDGGIRLLVAKEPDEPVPPADGFASLSTDELKQLCTVYEIEFKNRQQAIKALEGQ